MQTPSVSDPHLSISAEDSDALRSLLDWLRHEDALRGRVRAAHAPVRPGEMGGLLEVLEVALGSGGAGAVLATSVSTWLSQPRRADVKLTVTAEDGRHIELDARRVRDPAVLLREVERLLAAVDSEP
ncbi:MAG: effector-associated constant component EACC1 [Pseudonocardiaceae bacterium]